MALTKEQAAAFDAIEEDPEAFFASIGEDVRRSNPDMTEEQIEWSEGYARFVLGYPKPKPTLPNPEEVGESKATSDEKLAEDAEKP